MSKNEILAELPKLTPADRTEVRRRLAELDADSWDQSERLTEAEISLLNSRLTALEADAEAGASWEEVETRLRSRLIK